MVGFLLTSLEVPTKKQGVLPTRTRPLPMKPGRVLAPGPEGPFSGVHVRDLAFKWVAPNFHRAKNRSPAVGPTEKTHSALNFDWGTLWWASYGRGSKSKSYPQ